MGCIPRECEVSEGLLIVSDLIAYFDDNAKDRDNCVPVRWPSTSFYLIFNRLKPRTKWRRKEHATSPLNPVSEIDLIIISGYLIQILVTITPRNKTQEMN